MRDAVRRILEYTQIHCERTFLDDIQCQDAVLFQLSILGEAVVHVETSILQKYDYPWHLVRAQRNVISHAYFGIRIDMIWGVVRDELPGLRDMLDHILLSELEDRADP